MKFRVSFFQASRDPNEDGSQATSLKKPSIPILREKKSKAALNNGTDNGSERPRSRPGFGFLRRNKSRPDLTTDSEHETIDLPPVPVMGFLMKKRSMPNLRRADDGKYEAQSPASQQALQELLGKTEPKLAEGDVKPEGEYPQMKSTVVPTAHKQNSLSFNRGDDILERVVKASKDKKRTPRSFERRRESRSSSPKPSILVPPPPMESEPEPEPDNSQKFLSVDQVRVMSIGAPCFSVEEYNGRYKPQVIFRGSNAETSAEFPRDYRPFGHLSFAACTFSLDTSKEEADSNSEEAEIGMPTMYLSEVPNMIGADGLDPGAVGFEHFLQLPVADDVAHIDDFERAEQRKLLKSSPVALGLRPPNIEVLISRLGELGQLHASSTEQGSDFFDAWSGSKIEEMGLDLFGKLLSSEMGTTAVGTGSVSMKTQIKALQKVLRTSELWYDFALVDWRTRIGQLLWDNADVESSSVQDDEVSERDVVYLQITLAAELLIRLNAVKSRRDRGTPIVSERQVEILNTFRTTKVSWDLLLAQRFLENITVSHKASGEVCKKDNRVSLLRTISFLRATDSPNDDVQYLQQHLFPTEAPEEDVEYLEPQLYPKRGEQQLAGLLHFAETLQWPHAQGLPRSLDVTFDMEEKHVRLSVASSTYSTPSTSPQPQTTKGSESSSLSNKTEKGRPTVSRTATTQSVQLVPVRNCINYNAGFEACGWLSRSWLSGLVMPGEAASHFLMSTLLEHTPNVSERLGEKANLYGGFIYEGRSYWSKSCVVGRVLAAKRGATECMEWISVPDLGEAQDDGWIDVAVKEMPDSKTKPRIMNGEAVAEDSDLLHNNGWMNTARVCDFTWPSDRPLGTGREIICQGLQFNESSSNMPGKDDGPTARSIATVTFGSLGKKKVTTVEIPLIYDACFVSSYPCHPKAFKSSGHALPKPLKASSVTPSRTPSLHQKHIKDLVKEIHRPRSAPSPTDSGYASKATSASSTHGSFPAEVKQQQSQSFLTPIHPLHIDYHYDIVPVRKLFASATQTQPRALEQQRQQDTEMQAAAAKEVMVLDCRGPEDLELFARAWCAKVGENAVIGKSGRTCLACCIREARALGICVVIRT